MQFGEVFIVYWIFSCPNYKGVFKINPTHNSYDTILWWTEHSCLKNIDYLLNFWFLRDEACGNWMPQIVEYLSVKVQNLSDKYCLQIPQKAKWAMLRNLRTKGEAISKKILLLTYFTFSDSYTSFQINFLENKRWNRPNASSPSVMGASL